MCPLDRSQQRCRRHDDRTVERRCLSSAQLQSSQECCSLFRNPMLKLGVVPELSTAPAARHLHSICRREPVTQHMAYESPTPRMHDMHTLCCRLCMTRARQTDMSPRRASQKVQAQSQNPRLLQICAIVDTMCRSTCIYDDCIVWTGMNDSGSTHAAALSRQEGVYCRHFVPAVRLQRSPCLCWLKAHLAHPCDLRGTEQNARWAGVR